jgi:hypothetical protein
MYVQDLESFSDKSSDLDCFFLGFVVGVHFEC